MIDRVDGWKELGDDEKLDSTRPVLLFIDYRRSLYYVYYYM